MVIGLAESISEPAKSEKTFTDTVVQGLELFLAIHFERLGNFFTLMGRSQGNGDCRMCEFPAIGRFILQRFEAEVEEVRKSIEKDFGKVQITRERKKDEILGITAVRSEGFPR
jgi:hypothetical protein